MEDEQRRRSGTASQTTAGLCRLAMPWNRSTVGSSTNDLKPGGWPNKVRRKTAPWFGPRARRPWQRDAATAVGYRRRRQPVLLLDRAPGRTVRSQRRRSSVSWPPWRVMDDGHRAFRERRRCAELHLQVAQRSALSMAESCAGILLESKGASGRSGGEGKLDWLVVGIGVNVTSLSRGYGLSGDIPALRRG